MKNYDLYSREELIEKIVQLENIVNEIKKKPSYLFENNVHLSKIRENQKLYFNLFNSAVEPIFIIGRNENQEFVYVTFNSAFELFTGLFIATDVNRNIEDILPSKTAKFLISNYKKIYETGQVKSYEAQIEFKTGLRCFKTNLVPVKDNSGNVLRIIGISRDITEKKICERKLLESEERLKIALEAVEDGLWDWNVLTGEAYFSERYYKMLGFEPNEFAPASSDWNQIHPDDVQKVISKLHDYVSGKINNYIVEFRMRTKDGSYKWIMWRGKIIKRDDDGSVIRFIGTNTDITERKIIEEKYNQSELNFKKVIENSHEGIFIIDDKDRIVFNNNKVCEIIGYSFEELIGSNIFEFIEKNNHKNHHYTVEQMKCGNKVIDKIEFVGKNEKKVYLNFVSCPVFDESNKYSGYFYIMNDITEQKHLEEKVLQTSNFLLEKYSAYDIIGKSREMREIFEKLEIIAENDCNLLIEGPSGTGKSMIAEKIHNISSRKKRPFITINCGGFPETLLESELFGYVKGAFTGAFKDREGKIASADGGTIFLDEIGEMPLPLQVKLLRMIENKCFEQLGSNKIINADVRIIAATNRDLLKMVETGAFRADLYYRLKVINVKIPPLKDRPEDVEILIEYFLRVFNNKYNKKIIKVSDEVYEFFLSYAFPGNVRELQNILNGAFIFCQEKIIRKEHLPIEYIEVLENLKRGSKFLSFEEKGGKIKKTQLYEKDMHVNEIKLQLNDGKFLAECLRKFRNNKKKTAEYLGINEATLWRKLKKFNLYKNFTKNKNCGDGFNPKEQISENNNTKINKKLQLNENNKRIVAEKLGMSQATLWRRIKKYGI